MLRLTLRLILKRKKTWRFADAPIDSVTRLNSLIHGN
jgi:hypothetical protein